MPLPRVVEIMRQVSAALEAAHSEGVVHRDLKSDNIMLVEVGDNNADWAKVLDFGIAKIQESVGQDPALTAPNLIIGTPQYMSPEQCSQASEIDSRSDIYSLGVILYEMLVGHVPFTGESPTAIMMKHLQEAPPSVLEERKDLPAEVSRVVARALAKKPEDRFQSASELAQSLALAAEGEAMASGASATAATTAQGVPERDTNRIVVTTGPNEPPRGTSDEEYDESTIVHRREEKSSAYETQAMDSEAAGPAGPPPETFNPWRIVVPALVGLIVLFGVIYALTRNSAQPSANQGGPLVVDPGSQPVQPQPPPTGQGEKNINSNTHSATPGANANITSETNQNRNSAGASVNENSNNSNANRGNKNQKNGNTENQNGTEPDNTNNSNQDDDPRPVDETLPPVDDDAPPPMPTPTPKKRRQPPKPVEVPPDPAPQQSPSGASGLSPLR
jgi:serine/threonine-protein kinase